jgi:hypothetical protein
LEDRCLLSAGPDLSGSLVNLTFNVQTAAQAKNFLPDGGTGNLATRFIDGSHLTTISTLAAPAQDSGTPMPRVFVITLDISRPNAPIILQETILEGTYLGARQVGHQLDVFVYSDPVTQAGSFSAVVSHFTFDTTGKPTGPTQVQTYSVTASSRLALTSWVMSLDPSVSTRQAAPL